MNCTDHHAPFQWKLSPLLEVQASSGVSGWGWTRDGLPCFAIGYIHRVNIQWHCNGYPGCQLDYIWNGRAHLWSRSWVWKAGRNRFLTWILAWRSWGIVAMKNLGPGKVVHAFNPRRLKLLNLQVQGQPGTKQVPDPGMVVQAFNLGHTFCWRSA